MLSPVWLIADQATGEVSYIQHGLEGDEANWRWIGPFAFTSQAAALRAAKHPTFLPVGVKGAFMALEVDSSSFIQAIYNGFPPKRTDVFVLDQALLPLTANGALWIDEANGNPIWAPLFDADGEGVGLEWLDRVLQLVANRLQMSMETVQAIGILNAASEDEAAEVEQTHSIIQQHIRVALTPEPGTLKIGKAGKGKHLLTPAALFWLHTSGMVKLGLPELEIRNVPAWWVEAAGEELLNWAAYHLDHGIVEGVPLQGSGPVPLDIQVSDSPDPHWEGHQTGCLRLEVIGVTFVTDGDEDEIEGRSSLLLH